jgi:FtsH-binding integral membrane protein
MSEFDRITQPRVSSAPIAVAIDAGLRAHMLRVYNYMAAGVAVTGVVAWLTLRSP